MRQYICHCYVLSEPDPRGLCFWDRRSLAASDKSHRRYEDWRATGVPNDRVLVTASLAVFVASPDYHPCRPGPFLRIVMILLYTVSICLIVCVHQYFNEGEDGTGRGA
jgi:hypothetical protein